MKPVHLKSFLRNIGGEVIYGKANPLIMHVIKTAKYSLMKNHTMLFHNGKELSLKQVSRFKDFVIITSAPQLLADVGNNVTIVKVENVVKSYWKFIDLYRGIFHIPFVAVTGTCGKTTTKEMISWIFEKDRNVYKTISNNNDPTRHLNYLLGIEKETELVVMETAVAMPNHLKKAYRYFKPHVGILTSVGIDHLNGFPDLESYINEKLSIFKLIRNDGYLVINGDEEIIRQLDLSNINKRMLLYGTREDADLRLIEMNYEPSGMSFLLQHMNRVYKFSIPGVGKHNVYNATAAIATAYLLGLDIEEAGSRLKDFPHLPRHTEIVSGLNGSMLIDDTWSTNPTSIKAGLEVLSHLGEGRKKIAVFGEIKFLGDKSKEIHELVGNMLGEDEVDYLVTIGEAALPLALKAKEKGLNESRVYSCIHAKEAFKVLANLVDKDSVVLVKTSMYQSAKKLLKNLRSPS